MRLFAPTCGLLAWLALVWAGSFAWRHVTAQQSPAFDPPSPAADPVTPKTISAHWPALFGTPELVAQQPVQSNARDPTVVSPRFDMRLTGLVTSPHATWALIDAEGLARVVRVGDQLATGEVVRAINATGVWLLANGAWQVIPADPDDLAPLETMRAPGLAERIDLDGLRAVFADGQVPPAQ